MNVAVAHLRPGDEIAVAELPFSPAVAMRGGTEMRQATGPFVVRAVTADTYGARQHLTIVTIRTGNTETVYRYWPATELFSVNRS